MAAVGAVVVLLAVAGCGDDGDGDTSDTSETTTVGSTAPPGALQPGDPCSLAAGIPDCIDPDGDGDGTYLIGGADCMAALAETPELCTDLDGDGQAGYPDSG